MREVRIVATNPPLEFRDDVLVIDIKGTSLVEVQDPHVDRSLGEVGAE